MKNVPLLCVDGVVVDGGGRVLLTKRKIEPFGGYWHLPGGHVNFGEVVEEAVVRVVKEECGIKAEKLGLIGVYSDPKRDPRGHLVTVAFLMKPLERGGKSDFQSSEVKYFKELPERIGFDAREIVWDGLKKWRELNSPHRLMERP